VELLESTTSTLDVAHRLAADSAPAGTLVIANEQTSGRGRGGKEWQSPPGAGLWLTLVERPVDTSGLGVLSLRVGLAAAEALDRFATEPIRLKWPNDLNG
jgi:BirA family biotin operon repressor/biotin-[acetyl-CoA-carboxylase] ligase